MFHTKFCYSNELFTPSFKTELDPLSSDFLVYCVEYRSEKSYVVIGNALLLPLSFLITSITCWLFYTGQNDLNPEM